MISWNHHLVFCFYHSRWNSLLKRDRIKVWRILHHKNVQIFPVPSARPKAAFPETREGSSGLRSISFVQEQLQQKSWNQLLFNIITWKKTKKTIISMFHLLKPIQYCFFFSIFWSFSCNWDILNKKCYYLLFLNVWTGTESRICLNNQVEVAFNFGRSGFRSWCRLFHLWKKKNGGSPNWIP